MFYFIFSLCLFFFICEIHGFPSRRFTSLFSSINIIILRHQVKHAGPVFRLLHSIRSTLEDGTSTSSTDSKRRRICVKSPARSPTTQGPMIKKVYLWIFELTFCVSSAWHAWTQVPYQSTCVPECTSAITRCSSGSGCMWLLFVYRVSC